MTYLFPSSTITLDAALRDLAQGSPRARAFAAHALADVSDPTARRRAIEALLRALDDDRPEVRAEAVASLGALEDPSVIPALVKRLDDGVPAVRQNAAIALGTLGHPDGFEHLALALRQGPADLRFQAATSLAEIDASAAYEPLVAALADDDPQVVGAAALSLGAIGDRRCVPLLVPLLAHREHATRFDVAYALAELGDATGIAILVDALADLDRAWDAVTALAALGAAAAADTPARTTSIDALARALANKKVPPEATVLAAGALLRLAPDGAHRDAARRVVLAGLAARKTHVRGLAVEQLGEVGGAWATEPLEKLAASGKGAELAEAIATALRAIHEREAEGDR